MENIEIKLRPHHGLCMQFFEGKGYSKDFVEHMSKIVSLSSDTIIEITDVTDDICGHCPNKCGESCSSDEKVLAYDKRVMELCDFSVGERMRLGDFLARVERQIIKKGLQPSVCRECSWMEICKKKQDDRG